jgi:(S)-3,5-dihydroxyphenylglycine transaminase
MDKMDKSLLNFEALGHPNMGVVNFLNEVGLDFPDAIPFSSGQPCEDFFRVSDWLAGVDHFCESQIGKMGRTRDEVRNRLGQYGCTNGIINDLIARHLSKDEGIEVAPDEVMVTNGCQEAMTIALLGLFKKDRDALLVLDPTYFGMTGLALMLGIEVIPVPHDQGLFSFEALEQTIGEVRNRGKMVKGLYLIPDFNNPLGTSMALADRLKLLRLCASERVLILEDNPYGMFRYEGEKIPTLMALDKDATVTYMCSFAKTLCPGLRVGFLAGKQVLTQESGATGMIKELSKVKSLISCNTSPILQAAAGAVLLAHDCSLQGLIRPVLEHYDRNRRCLLASLEACFGAGTSLHGRVTWNTPKGGFFLTMSLPFVFTKEHLRQCAEEYGTLVLPLSFFSIIPAPQNRIRLSFSFVTLDQIQTGLRKLADFVERVCSELSRSQEA